MQTVTSEDEEEDDDYENETKESLIQKLNQQKHKFAKQQQLIEKLTSDLQREKKINDMMIEQAAYVRSLQRKAYKLNLSDLSLNSS